MPKSENKNIKVFFRFFPIQKLEPEYLKVDGNTVYMRQFQDLAKGHDQNHKLPNYWEFKSDGVFFNIDQKDMYAHIIDGVLERVIDGDNGVILAYGQTRSGKTVTVGGLQLSEQDFGITPRVIFDLFRLKRDLPRNIKMCIQMSYTEFSNTTAADLLKSYPYSMNVYHSRDATKIKITSEFDGLKLLFKGEGRKTFAGSNEYLSHLCSSVVTFHITTADTDFSEPKKNRSRLHIIDMAGVDTVGNPSCVYKHAPDIGNANVIKTNLERFVLLLRQNVPLYIRLNERANPLIYFLGSDLSNESMFRFIGHIRTHKRDLVIAISLLRFGQLVRGIKPKHKEIVPEVNEEVQLQHLQKEIEELEEERLHNSVLLNQDLTKIIDKERLDHIHRLIKQYLNDEVTEITVLNVAEASEVFKALKQMCNECEAEKCKLSDEMQLELSKYKHDSKTSTTSLKASKATSKRSSKKSRDNISSEKSRSMEKKVSSQTLSDKKGSNKMPSKRSSMSGSQINKKGSNLSAKRSTISKRKSTTSASISDRKDSKTSEMVLLPDIIPEYPEAWSMFIKDMDEFYNDILEEYRANENELQETYAIYSTEIRKLQCYKEIFEKRKNELYEAQMIKKFRAQETYNSSQDQLIVSSTEKLSLDNFNSAQETLVEQQEVVLKWQSEIKICLNKRTDIKKRLNEEFDIYCKEKFSATIPDLDEEGSLFQEETTKIDLELATKEPEEDKTCIGTKETEIRLEELKKIMKKELLRNMKIRVKERNTWKNYPLKIC